MLFKSHASWDSKVWPESVMGVSDALVRVELSLGSKGRSQGLLCLGFRGQLSAAYTPIAEAELLLFSRGGNLRAGREKVTF